MPISENLHPMYSGKTSGAMKAARAVKRITFNPGDTCPSLTKMRFLCQTRWRFALTSNLSEATPTTFYFRTSRGRSLTSLGAPPCKNTSATTSTKTFADLFLPREKRSQHSRGFRARTYVRSARARRTRKPLTLPQKPN